MILSHAKVPQASFIMIERIKIVFAKFIELFSSAAPEAPAEEVEHKHIVVDEAKLEQNLRNRSERSEDW